MNKELLRDLVVKYRDEDGITFQGISDILRAEYGIIRDRQSIYGIYKRAKDKAIRNEKIYDPEMVLDIINLYVIGYNKSKIVRTLHKTYKNIRISIVDEVLKDGLAVDSVRKTRIYGLIEAINDKIELSLDNEEIRKRLSYKGEIVTENQFKELTASAYAVVINNIITNEMVCAYRLCKDMNIIKLIRDKIDTDVPVSEIKARI